MTEQIINNNLNIPQNIDLTTINRNNNDELIKSTKSYETRLNNKIGEIVQSFSESADKQNNLIDRLKSTTTAFLKIPSAIYYSMAYHREQQNKNNNNNNNNNKYNNTNLEEDNTIQYNYGLRMKQQEDGSLLVDDAKHGFDAINNIKFKEDDRDLIFTFEDGTEKRISKSEKKIETFREIYNDTELKNIKANTPEFKDMNDDEWNKYLDTPQEWNYLLNSEYANQYTKATSPFTEEQIKEISEAEPLTIADYMFESNRIRKLTPVFESIALKIKANEKLTEEELGVIEDFAVFQANVNLRGVSFGGRLTEAVSYNILENTKATTSQLAVDAME